jgi:hypothetical protein
MCLEVHLNGDITLCFPFYLLRSLAKMSKRVQNHPTTADKSMFHQGLIKSLVLYALRELQLSWNGYLVH